MSHSVWQIDRGQQVELQLADFRAILQMTQPAQGLTDIRAGSYHLKATGVLGIEIPPSARAGAEASCECRPRRACLVANYRESEDWPIRVEAAWHAAGPSAAHGALATLELVVSVETQLLDSRPELTLRSFCPVCQVSRLVAPEGPGFEPVKQGFPRAIKPDEGPGCLLFRLPPGDLSYAEMVHPYDFRDSRLQTDEGHAPTVCLHHRLFGGSLEKGVIRRARVRGVFLRREDDARRAAESYARFVAAEPPLGT